ncbi:hypothetical protein ASG72_18585 [Bosea sp. Leaf344]|uniref:autotransporter family protein n=1 Tax=Bosea sp. Leaf344 TaxID=1736346 RepID=UPI0006FA648C|nr:autotransporter outer membrane beta-barrel domain-containing protein [Bosea sp. Leaf344]KQU50014.1 hypothetical protein ASG72_18585 [Bosea sp. Leaf344]
MTITIDPCTPFGARLARPAGRRNSWRPLSAIAWCLISTSALTQPASADETWTGASDSNWRDSLNWTGNVPSALDVVTIDGRSHNMPRLTTGAGFADRLSVIGGGTLGVSNSSRMTAGATVIGDQSGTGVVVVEGNFTSWSSKYWIQLGLAGIGSLTVKDGAKLTTEDGSLQMGAGGTLTIDGLGTLVDIGTRTTTPPADWAGAAGWLSANQGTVTVSGGARLVDDGGYVGGEGTTWANMTVTGKGTVWQNGLNVYVGGDGNGRVGFGRLTVADGANVVAHTGAVGVDVGSFGELLLTDAGSRFEVLARPGFAGNMRVGFNGDGKVTVRNGATLMTANFIEIASSRVAKGVLAIGGGLGDAPAAPGTIDARNGIKFGAGDATLLFNHTSKSFRFDQTLSGDQGRILQQAGTTVFVGDGARFAGTTSVTGGALMVNSSLEASAVSVAEGGLLGGSGKVGSTRITGGILAPGNSIGTLTVKGDLSFTAASTYAVEVSPIASDRVDVAGRATLGGAKVATSFQPGTYVAKQYGILSAAGGVSGVFGQKVDSNLPAGFKSALSYDPNNVFLDLTLDFTPAAATPTTPGNPVIVNRGLNPNQSSAANALTGYFERRGGIPMVFGSLTTLGLSQIAGEPAAAVQTNSSAALTQFMGTLTDGLPGERGVSLASGPSGFASYTSAKGQARDLPVRQTMITPDPDLWRWSVWGSGFGGVEQYGATVGAGTAATTNRVFGAAAGADYRVSPEMTLGFGLGGGATNFNIYRLGSGSSDLFQAGLFLRRQFGASYLNASAAYAWQDVTTDRTLSTSEHLQGRFNANAYAGRIEAGHNIRIAGLSLTPFAAAQLSLLSLPGYRETALTGPGTFALSFAGKDTTRLRSELGLRVEREVGLAGMGLTLRGSAAWVANSNTRSSATATFQALPGATFLVRGAGPDRNALRTSAAAELKLGKGMTLAATFDGEFARNSRSLGGKAALRYSW